MNSNRPTPRHIIIKVAEVKDKERIMKAAREKQRVTYKGIYIRLSQARREWHNVFNELKGKKSCNLGHSTQQDYYLELKKRSRTSQANKN